MLRSPKPVPALADQSKASFTRKKRLSSLDTLRGLTVFMMIFVDEIGATWPFIDHCPWNGIHLADFVMPYFNFMIGVGVAFSMRKFIKRNNKYEGFKKAAIRFLKLFFIGMFTQGGIDIADYDMKHIRIMGILQRVAFCYGFAVIIELFIPSVFPLSTNNNYPEIVRDDINSNNLVNNIVNEQNLNQDLLPPDAIDINEDYSNNNHNNNNNIINEQQNESLWQSLNVFMIYRYHWLASLAMLALWIGIMYGVNVPDQYGEKCGRGILTPACNAQGYIDKHILTWDHMYFPSNGGEYDPNDPYSADVTFQRTSHCSSCSPGKCLKDEDVIPEWCLHAAFDPEGLISSITCVLSPIFGLHCGHLLQLYKEDKIRMSHFGIIGIVEIIIGLILHFTKVSVLNTDLYSPSFLILTAGSATLTLMILYYIMDIKIYVYRNIRGSHLLYYYNHDDIEQDGNSDYESGILKFIWNSIDYVLMYPLECIGRNAFGIFILAESGIVNWFFEIFYWNIDKNSLANIFWPTGEIWGPKDDEVAKHPWLYSPVMMVWVLGYCIFWTLCAIYFHRNKMYWVL